MLLSSKVLRCNVVIFGIDLDNTIINYKQSFINLAIQYGYLSKQAEYQGKQVLKQQIITNYGEGAWMKLQGQVYSSGLITAELFSGVKNVLESYKQQGVKLLIVSHKTKIAHFQPKAINLRELALQWLELQGIVGSKASIPLQQIYFTDTQAEKVAIIAQLQCDYFLDDLPAVLMHQSFPKKTKKLYFNPVKKVLSYDYLLLQADFYNVA